MFQSKPTLHMKRTNKQTKTYLFEFGYHSGVSSCVSVFMIHHCSSVQVLPQSPILIVFIVYLQHKRICIGTISLYKFVVMVKKTIITTALVLLLMCNADTLTKKHFFWCLSHYPGRSHGCISFSKSSFTQKKKVIILSKM